MVHLSKYRASRGFRALFMPVALVLAAIGPLSVAAALPKALINGATVSGPSSTEELDAIAAGFAVTVVDDATWATYTAADFVSTTC
jgi:hypothetical protein